MRIGIIGTGKLGGGLARAWQARGHEVRLGNREPGTTAAAAEHGEVVVLAVPFEAVEAALETAGPLEGKILVDCVNAIAWGEQGPRLLLTHSVAEHIARRRPKARVVKAFNTLGANHLGNLGWPGITPDTFLCGDDEEARGVVSRLAEDVGFGVVDCGPLASAGMIEHLALTWIYLSGRGGYGRDIAFKLLR
jgi:predicted dinucleotide-binding enzyme